MPVIRLINSAPMEYLNELWGKVHVASGSGQSLGYPSSAQCTSQRPTLTYWRVPLGLWFTVMERTLTAEALEKYYYYYFYFLCCFLIFIIFLLKFLINYFSILLTFSYFILFLFLFSEFLLCCCCLFSDLVLLVLFLFLSFLFFFYKCFQILQILFFHCAQG